MKLVKVVNGIEYSFTTGRNYTVGEAVKGDYDGYSLIHEHNGFKSTIFFKSKNFFNKESKNIGVLLYDYDANIVTYKKYGFKQLEHTFHKTESMGLNWDIISNLCPKDKILIESKTDEKRTIFTISVSKAMKFQEFMYFKPGGYEKQIFIPISEFKVIETGLKKRGKSGGRKTDQKGKTGN